MTKLIPTEHDLRQLMRDYFEAKVADAFGEYHEAFGMMYAPGTHPGTGLDPYGFIAAAQGELMRLKALSAKHEFTDAYQDRAYALLERRGFENSIVHANMLAQRLLEAEIEAKRIELAYHQREFGQIPVQHPRLAGCKNLFEEPDFTTIAARPSVPLKECIALYLEAKAETVRGRTLDRIRSVLDRLQELIGAERQMSSIVKHPDGVALERMVRRLPKNYAQNFKGKGKSLHALIEADISHETLDPKTQASYWIYYQEFFTWARNRDYIQRSPIESIEFKIRKSDDEGRIPFTAEQLNILFQSAIYTGRKHHKQSLWKRGNIKTQDGYFWLPLIGLFSGMRLAEILKLRPQDVREEEGVLFFDVHTVSELKNKQSIRQIPVHPELLKIGLRSYLDKRRKAIAGSGYLFEDGLSIPENQPIIKNYSRSFSTYTVKSGMRREKDGRDVFHSFRHNFHTALYEGGVDSFTAARLAGHKPAKELMTTGDAVYTKRNLTLPMLYDAVAKISYDLDFSHLYVQV